MTNNLPKNMSRNEIVTLSPNPRLPLLLCLLGLLLLPLTGINWISIIIITFGIFLLIQTLILRLEFNSEALVVKQLGRNLRTFPFKDWISWRLLLPELPGLLYFREEASPHLLPILFDSKMLESQLRLRVPSLEKPMPS